MAGFAYLKLDNPPIVRASAFAIYTNDRLPGTKYIDHRRGGLVAGWPSYLRLPRPPVELPFGVAGF